MCCLRIDTETLLYNCCKSDSNSACSVQNLKNIVKRIADFFGRYIYSNLQMDDLVKVVDAYPEQFAFTGYDELKVKSKADSSTLQRCEKYFNFGYEQEITDKIAEFARLELEGQV